MDKLSIWPVLEWTFRSKIRLYFPQVITYQRRALHMNTFRVDIVLGCTKKSKSVTYCMLVNLLVLSYKEQELRQPGMERQSDLVRINIFQFLSLC
jgi:hypothetical protein